MFPLIRLTKMALSAIMPRNVVLRAGAVRRRAGQWYEVVMADDREYFVELGLQLGADDVVVFDINDIVLRRLGQGAHLSFQARSA